MFLPRYVAFFMTHVVSMDEGKCSIVKADTYWISPLVICNTPFPLFKLPIKFSYVSTSSFPLGLLFSYPSTFIPNYISKNDIFIG
jgi:hypothetical protein